MSGVGPLMIFSPNYVFIYIYKEQVTLLNKKVLKIPTEKNHS